MRSLPVLARPTGCWNVAGDFRRKPELCILRLTLMPLRAAQGESLMRNWKYRSRNASLNRGKKVRARSFTHSNIFLIQCVVLLTGFVYDCLPAVNLEIVWLSNFICSLRDCHG